MLTVLLPSIQRTPTLAHWFQIQKNPATDKHDIDTKGWQKFWFKGSPRPDTLTSCYLGMTSGCNASLIFSHLDMNYVSDWLTKPFSHVSDDNGLSPRCFSNISNKFLRRQIFLASCWQAYLSLCRSDDTQHRCRDCHEKLHVTTHITSLTLVCTSCH